MTDQSHEYSQKPQETAQETGNTLTLSGFTQKQRRFVDEYLVDMNATQAAIRAGYSRKTAYSIGDENLRKPYISAEIAQRQRQIAENLKLTHEVVVAGLHREATLRGEGASHGARVSAWVQLGKHLGMFDKGIDISNHPEVREVRRGLVRFIDATHSAIRDLCPPQLAEHLQLRILESIDPTSLAAEYAPNMLLTGGQTVDVNRHSAGHRYRQEQRATFQRARPVRRCH